MSLETQPTFTEVTNRRIEIDEVGSIDPFTEHDALDKVVESLKDGPIPLENKLGEAALEANKPILGTENQADMDHWTTPK